MFRVKRLIYFLIFLVSPEAILANSQEIQQLCHWRAKLERIYHDSRLPPKRPFAEEFPPAVIQGLVLADLRKERVLERVYGVVITWEMLEEEIRRIEENTKDPEKLARIKTALGPDTTSFAETVAKPIIVERLLRLKFYQDKLIHAAEREKAITTLRAMKAGSKSDGIEARRWLLRPRPSESDAADTNTPPTTAYSSTPSYINQATAQVTQAGGKGGQQPQDSKQYFSDLDPELQAVLKNSLQKPGDVSPIIESTSGFSIYRLTEVTIDEWTVESAFIPRKSFDAWLASQGNTP